MKQFSVTVEGRPAPQGSKEYGDQGQLLEASKYLPPWRQAIKKAVYQRYYDMGLKPRDFRGKRFFTGPIGLSVVFWLDTGQRIDSPPDLDKLVRAVLDALTLARVYEDDGRVVVMREVRKAQAIDRPTGADIWIWQEGEANEL